MTEPKNKDRRYEHLRKLLAKKKFNQARRYALENAGADSKFLVEVAMVFKALGKLQTAKQLFKQATKIEPENGLVHYTYGLFLKSTKQLKDAEVEFKLVLEHETNDDVKVQARCMLGNTLLEQNRTKSALKEFEAVLDRDAKNIHALTGRAAVHIKRNEYEDAEALLKKVIKLDKKYPVPYLNLVMMYKHQGREKDLKKMVKLAKRAKLEIKFDDS